MPAFSLPWRVHRHQTNGLRRRPRRPLRRQRRRCFAELLEQRCVLAAVAWDGGGDGTFWHDPLNWNDDTLPSAEDDVTIDVAGDITVRFNSDTGTQTVKSLQVTERFEVTGGTLDIAAASELSGPYTQQNSVVGGSGDLTLSGPASLTNARLTGPGKLIVSSQSAVDVFSSTRFEKLLENFGTINLKDTATVTVGPAFASGIRAINRAEGQFIVSNGADLIGGGEGTTFLNEGTFTKTGTAKTEFIAGFFGIRTSLSLENTGTIDLREGELKLSGGASSTTPIEVPENTTLTFRNDVSYAAPTGLFGSGTINFDAGVHDFTGTEFLPTGEVNFNGATVTIANEIAPASLSTFRGIVNFDADQTLDSITLAGTIGGSGDLTLRGTTTFGLSSVGGTRIEGSGSLLVPSDGVVNANNGLVVHRFLENSGTFNVVGPGSISIGAPFAGGVRGINRAGGQFIIGNGADILSGGDNATFLNEGTFIKTGSEVTEFFAGFAGIRKSLSLQNTGTIDLREGELRLLAGGGSTTPIEVPANTTLTFRDDFSYAQPVGLFGDGTINFDSGDHDFSETTLGATGNLNFNGATVTIANRITPASLGTFKGLVNFDVDHAFESITVEGRIGGSGELTLTGTSSLKRGSQINGGGKLVVPVGATVNAEGTTITKVLENFGSTTVAGNISTRFGPSFGGGTRVINRPGGEFRIDGEADLFAGGNIVFLNEGNLTKAGLGTSSLVAGNFGGVRSSITLENPGTLQILAGELDTTIAPAEVTGTVNVAAGAVWDVGTGVDFASSSILIGGGTIEGDVTSAGSVTPGDELGALQIEGDYTQTATGSLSLQLGGRTEGSNYDQLLVRDTVILDGSLAVFLADGFFPGIADEFTVMTFVDRSGDFASETFPEVPPFELVSTRNTNSLGLAVEQQPNVGLLPTFRGVAQPNSEVTVTASGSTIGTAIADGDGLWAV